MVESVWLATHELIIFGTHLKLAVFCNQRCHVQLVSAFFLMNALGDLVVLGLAMGVSTVCSETTSGFNSYLQLFQSNW